MEINSVTRTVKVTISNTEILMFFVRAVSGDAKNARDSRDATAKEWVCYKALGHLVGISDTDAVKIANAGAKKENRITTEEFRRWLPTVFAEFARAMMRADDEAR